MRQTLDSVVAESVQECFKTHLVGTNSQMAHPHRSSSNYSCGTRLARIEFPRFNGDEVKQWIYRCESYFAIDGTPDEEKTKLAIVNLEGKALQWQTSMVKSFSLDNLPTWTKFKVVLTERFRGLYDDPMADQIRLQQTGLVAEYQEKFESVVSRLQLSEEYKISCFLSGLKHDIQMMVRMFQPTTVLKAAQLAKLYESTTPSASPPSQFLKFPKNSVVTKPLLSLSSSNKGDFTSTKNRKKN